jgi:hypothetical protein
MGRPLVIDGRHALCLCGLPPAHELVDHQQLQSQWISEAKKVSAEVRRMRSLIDAFYEHRRRRD